MLTSIAATTFVGLDVHQDSISVALLRPGGQLADEDQIANTAEAVRKLVRRWKDPRAVRVCYEAGPTGYGLQRTFTSLGVDCAVIAPALIPRRAGERVKTDRRDARKLVGLFRAGELTAIRIPPPEEEAGRDLIRAREDLSEDILRARHRLSKFLLRHDRVYREGKTRWTERHLAWVRRQRFETAGLEELVGHHLAIIEARLRQRDLMDEAIARIAESEPYTAAVRRLCCLRGIKPLSALTLLVEVGDFRRFATAAGFMGFTGLVPSEASSGARHHRGSITKDWQRAPASGPRRSGLGLSPEAGTRHGLATAFCRSASRAGGVRHRRAAAPARALLAHDHARQALDGHHRRHRPRARGLHLGRDERALGLSGPEAPGNGRAHPAEGSSIELCGRRRAPDPRV